jgi:hypothetical protein
VYHPILGWRVIKKKKKCYLWQSVEALEERDLPLLHVCWRGMLLPFGVGGWGYYQGEGVRKP